jgi:transcriptional regulator with XRE-family HTH domain
VEFETFAQRVGANLRKARWLRGWTQDEVAARGITYRYYQELERGERNPTLKTLLELAGILGVTVADLVNVPGSRPAEVPLSARQASAPKRGRKPRPKRRARS